MDNSGQNDGQGNEQNNENEHENEQNNENEQENEHENEHENGQNSDREQKPSENDGFKESVYDKIPLTKKQLDIIIIILMIALIGFLVFGVLVGNGIL